MCTESGVPSLTSFLHTEPEGSEVRKSAGPGNQHTKIKLVAEKRLHLLERAIQCIRGARSSCGHTCKSVPQIDLVSSATRLSMND